MVTRTGYYGRRAILQPGNHEWVTTIEVISTGGYSLPPFVTFKGQAYIAGRFESTNLPDDWRIKVLNNGWTTDEISLLWLQELFIPLTNSRVLGRYQLLTNP